MLRLLSEAPLGGLDVTHGHLRLRVVDPGRITWLAPFPGDLTALSHALKGAFSLSFPKPGEAQDSGAGRILWSGRSQALLIGPAPLGAFSAHGAVVDQTETWAVLVLTGKGGADVLARLVPFDIRAGAFPVGRTARSLLGHMNAQITAREDGFEILVMRSMAGSAVRELEHAMRSVAARSAV